MASKLKDGNESYEIGCEGEKKKEHTVTVQLFR